MIKFSCSLVTDFGASTGRNSYFEFSFIDSELNQGIIAIHPDDPRFELALAKSRLGKGKPGFVDLDDNLTVAHAQLKGREPIPQLSEFQSASCVAPSALCSPLAPAT
ncbi:MAG: hypothetical protein V4555_02965 [Acidobacteriota bacterium]